MKAILFSCIALLICSNGCNQLTQATGADTSGTVCYWFSAVKDCYVSSATPDANHGLEGQIAVQEGVLERRLSYVDFSRAQFPEGTEFQYAKLELFHGGKNEDGTTDDVILNVGSVRTKDWTATTTTWNNRPDFNLQPASGYSLFLRSQAWSGTQNIVSEVDSMFNHPERHFGFEVSVGNTNVTMHKGFYSNNDISRTSSVLGKAPRLLVIVKLPSGKTTADVKLPFLPTGHDLGRLTQPVTTVRFAAGNSFPAEWEVSPER